MQCYVADDVFARIFQPTQVEILDVLVLALLREDLPAKVLFYPVVNQIRQIGMLRHALCLVQTALQVLQRLERVSSELVVAHLHPRTIRLLFYFGSEVGGLARLRF